MDLVFHSHEAFDIEEPALVREVLLQFPLNVPPIWKSSIDPTPVCLDEESNPHVKNLVQ